MTLLQRLGLVAWWLGTLIGAALLCIAAWILIAGNQHDAAIYATGWAIASIVIALPCWALAFVLGGSFWRPSRPPPQAQSHDGYYYLQSRRDDR